MEQTTSVVNSKTTPSSVCETVRALAAQGLREEQIAAHLLMGLSTFQKRKRDDAAIRAAYREGFEAARSARRAMKEAMKKKPQPKFGEPDEYLPKLTRTDLLVKKAALAGARHYPDFRALTGLDDRKIVKALERLQLHSKVTKIEGLFFDEWIIL